MHHIDGLSTAAAQYQAYLERMRTAHSEEDEEKKVRRRNEGRNFQEHLEPQEEESEGNPEDKPQQDNEEEAPQDTTPDDGFGSHYA